MYFNLYNFKLLEMHKDFELWFPKEEFNQIYMDNESVLIHTQKCMLIIGNNLIKGKMHLTT